jgi:urease accessory protein
VDTLALHGELSVVIATFQKVFQVGVILILERCMYVFLLNHAKAVMSAAVRLSLVGPYQAQTILAAPQTRRLVKSVLDEVRNMSIDDAGQTWALLDIYQGRQEILYSRVFNG